METDPQRILIALAKPFLPDEIDWRVGSTSRDKTSGIALAYIDARAVMDRFDAVMGVNWKCEYPTIQRTGASIIGDDGGRDRGGDRDGGEGGKKKPRSSSLVVCRISLKIGDEWIWREDGAGDSAVEAEKGALSDALKRAAVRWGVGRFLYALPSPWVKLDQYKKIVDDEWSKLRKIAEKALAEYERNPAHRPPPPAPELASQFAPPAAPAQPARPASAPAATRQPTPQPGPAAPGSARPAVTRVEQLAAAIRGEASPGPRAQLFATARAELPAALHTFEAAFVDAVCKDLERADSDQVERIAGYLRTAGLTRGEQAEQKVRGALALARSRAT